MENFVPLRSVFEKVGDLVGATAEHLDAIAEREAHRDGRSREALLARSIASQRCDLAEAMREYSAVAPENVKARWFQYTTETDDKTLLADLKATQTVSEAITSLDRIDQALKEVFDLTRRQELPEDTRLACEWAEQQIERELERRASTLRTSIDV